MKYIIPIIITIFILFNFIKKDLNINVLTSKDTILAFGDSLTYGYNTEPSKSYPSILSRKLGMKVINAGVIGETSEGGLKRLPKLLKDNSIKLMILCFGGNDILQKKSMLTLKDNIKNIIQMAKKKNIDVLLISVPNISLFGLSPLELYKEVAEEENIPILEGMLGNILSKPSLKSDRIHPNALGYKEMAEKIYESLIKHGWI